LWGHDAFIIGPAGGLRHGVEVSVMSPFENEY
jgi:hypothetical protein